MWKDLLQGKKYTGARKVNDRERQKHADQRRKLAVSTCATHARSPVVTCGIQWDERPFLCGLSPIEWHAVLLKCGPGSEHSTRDHVSNSSAEHAVLSSKKTAHNSKHSGSAWLVPDGLMALCTFAHPQATIRSFPEQMLNRGRLPWLSESKGQGDRPTVVGAQQM